MPRSRSRSRSSSDSYSSSEDEEERMEREARARERREEREHKRAQRRADRKQERLEAAATKKAGALEWRFFIPPPENVVDEDPFESVLRAKNFCTNWAGATAGVDSTCELEPHLRSQFEVPDTVKKIGLKGKVLLDGEVKLQFKVSDQRTLSTAHMQIVDLGEHLLNASEVKVKVEVVSMCIGVKLKGKSKPRTHKQEAAKETLKELKRAVYGHHLPPVQLPSGTVPGAPYMQYAAQGEQKGKWTAAASNIMRQERGTVIKFHDTRMLCGVVMGDPDYHPNPVILVCPWAASCGKAHRHLNGFSAVSQLYSHWQQQHKDNKAARVLEARWRLANDLTDHGKKKVPNLADRLDEQFPLVLTNDEMVRLGGPTEGYEAVNTPSPSTADFKHRFDVNSMEHAEWLKAFGSV